MPAIPPSSSAEAAGVQVRLHLNKANNVQSDSAGSGPKPGQVAGAACKVGAKRIGAHIEFHGSISG